MGLGLCYSGEYSLWFTCYRDDPTTTIPRPSGCGSRIAASLTFVCTAFLIGPSIKNSSRKRWCRYIISGQLCWRLPEWCFTSSASNRRVRMWYLRIVAQPSLNQSANPETESPAVYVVHRCAVCADFDLRAVSASSLFYVRYVLNDTGLFTVLVLVQNTVGTVASAPLVPGMVARIGKEYLPDWRFAGEPAVICCSSGFPSGHCRWRWLRWPSHQLARRYHDRDGHWKLIP